MYFPPPRPSRTVLDGLAFGFLFVKIFNMKKILFIIFVLLVCGGLGFYFYQKLSPKTQNGVIVGQSNSSSSQTAGNTVNIGGVTIQGEGDMKGVKIEPIVITNNKPAVNVRNGDRLYLNAFHITFALNDDSADIYGIAGRLTAGRI